MMQVLPIILVAVVMMADGGIKPLGAAWDFSGPFVLAELWVPPLLMVLLAWMIVSVCVKRLRRRGSPRPYHIANATVVATRWFIVANHIFAVLVLDALGAVRSVVGNLVLVDELLVILPGVIALVASWWVYYPIERLFHEASMIRRLDVGSPLYPSLTRGQYVLVQARINLLLLLLPVLMIAGVTELIEDAWTHWSIGPVGVGEAVTLVAAAGVFMVSPLLARTVLDTESLPSGPLRDTLGEVCARHRVGVRDLLLWKTNGSMINAAVMGLIAPLRYVLITDALLETLHEREVKAVMAHEVGHVRRRHMVWMVLCLIACFMVAAYAIELPLRFAQVQWSMPQDWAEYLVIFSGVAQLALGLFIFGWVCRRFERQADTFAVQHLSGLGTAGDAAANVTLDSVDAMRGALQSIAELNTVDPAKRSWRHGSIRWRQMYLETLIGRPLMALPIDRLVRRLKIATAIVLVLGFAYELVAQRLAAEQMVPRLSGEESAVMMNDAYSPLGRAQMARAIEIDDSVKPARLTGVWRLCVLRESVPPVNRGTALMFQETNS